MCSKHMKKKIYVGDPVSLWSALWMRDDEWGDQKKSSKRGVEEAKRSQMMEFQHLYCVLLYVSHLPTKEELAKVIARIMPHYPQLRNIPLIAQSMIRSSFKVSEMKVEEHIYECRVDKKILEGNLDELCLKQKMDPRKPWWDVYLLTPNVPNDEEALNPLQATLCVVVFRFHQAIIDLPTVEQWVNDLSNCFRRLYHHSVDDFGLNGNNDNDIDDIYNNINDDEEEDEKMTELINEKQTPNPQPQFQPSKNKSKNIALSKHKSKSKSKSIRRLIDENTEDRIEEEIAAMNRDSTASFMSQSLNNRVKWLYVHLRNLYIWVQDGLTIAKIWLNADGNVFSNDSANKGNDNGNDNGNDQANALIIVNQSFEDTPFHAIAKQSRAKFTHIARSCVAGAIVRYCNDESSQGRPLDSQIKRDSKDNNNDDGNDEATLSSRLGRLSKARILEDFDLSQNETLPKSPNLFTSLFSRFFNHSFHTFVGVWKGTHWVEMLPSPLFQEKIGLTSIPLAIGEQFAHARQRLMHVAKPTDVFRCCCCCCFFFCFNDFYLSLFV
ncbi:hypothetical protein RFI_16855 [Reticulomyxa filosa]|uniref:Uncharacterized protein n=1 Tax=Reticulomyxa filosa TaxID=46433 RepID=X6N3P7_RETFI|nr:hypothetical protein RFI_16855 [Reticulomyxa filosa]|eukprot:ETO20364.1 hypothetical protein RFI_16855 [Reticulomyxa filosa]